MAIYIKDFVIKTIGLGNIGNPPIYIQDTKVFPTGVVTHKLTGIALYYSSGSYLYPDKSNYAYVGGTYVTYVDDVEQSRTIVECKPTYTYAVNYVTLVGNRFYWNKEDFGSQERVAMTWNGITGGTYEGTTISNRLTINCGANTMSYNSAKINTLILSPSTLSCSATTIYTTISGVRYGTWTSGNEFTDTFKGGAYGTDMTYSSTSVDTQQAANPRVGYYFKNNGAEPLKINYYFYAEVTYRDTESSTEDWSSNLVSGTTTIAAGATFNTGSFECPIELPPTAESEKLKTYDTYFYLDGSTQKYTLTTSSQNLKQIIEYGTEYYKLSTSNSWLAASGMTISVAANTGTAARTGTITVSDKQYTATLSKSITQAKKGVTYTMEIYYDSAQLLIEDGSIVEVSAMPLVLWDAGDNERQYTVNIDDSSFTYHVDDDYISIEGELTSSTDAQVTITEASSGGKLTFYIQETI